MQHEVAESAAPTPARRGGSPAPATQSAPPAGAGGTARDVTPGRRWADPLAAMLARSVARRGAAAAGGPLLQRQVLTRLEIQTMADGAQWIWDVTIGGRTPSPFAGTMGAHSTAWVAHIEEIRRVLVNRRLVDAAQALHTFASGKLAEDAGSLYELRDRLGAPHQRLLTAAHGRAVDSAAALLALAPDPPVGVPDPVALQAAMRKLIDDYLTFVNYLPGATVQGGDPRGHGEGSARGELARFEYVYALHRRQEEARTNAATPQTADEAPLLVNAVAGLPASDPVKVAHGLGFDRRQCPWLVRYLVQEMWQMFAAETPDIFAGSLRSPSAPPSTTVTSAPTAAMTPDELRLRVWTLMLTHFLTTMSAAYPYTFDFTEMHKAEIQREGLLFALQEANVAIDDSFATALLTALPHDEAWIRDIEDDYAEVSDSDIRRTGGEFRVMVLLDAPAHGSGGAVVGDVEMIGRTTSPFSGTMGAHSTAWIAHLDAMRSLLTGKRLDAAIAALQARALTGLNDPSLCYAHLLDEKHQGFLLWAHNTVRNLLAQTPGTDELPRLQYLEGLIREYMTYLNFLPMSTVAIGGVPGGRTEGRTRRFLLQYEEIGAHAIPSVEWRPVDAILREALESLYDPKAVKAFPPDLGDRETPQWASDPVYGYSRAHPLWARFHQSGSSAPDKEQLARERFYRTLSEAYPRSVADSGLLGASAAVSGEQQGAIDSERHELQAMLVNNCLIKAIADSKHVVLTYEHLVEIRRRLGEIGTMLVASPRTISIIGNVLGVRGVVVVYPDPIPSEGFGDQSNPAVIRHTGAEHFVAFAANAGADLGMYVKSGDARHKRKPRSSSGRPPRRVPALVGTADAGAATPADPVQPPLKKRRGGPP